MADTLEQTLDYARAEHGVNSMPLEVRGVMVGLVLRNNHGDLLVKLGEEHFMVKGDKIVHMMDIVDGCLERARAMLAA